MGTLRAADADDAVTAAVKNYFTQRFADLQKVADTRPMDVKTFREAMKPVAENTEGFFGGTLIDTNFVIAEVYFKRDVLARGFDLKKVKELDAFWAKMRQKPEPQLSEPGHGNLIQPRLIAMRYPFLAEGKLQGIVSMMIRTEAFLSATGLDQVKAFQISVDGQVAESHGDISASPITARIRLPSTEWEIRYDR
jgi:hypothetical protein